MHRSAYSVGFRSSSIVLGLIAAACTLLSCSRASAGKTAGAKLVSEYPKVPPVVVEAVYSAKLQPGWNDYGWAERSLNQGPAALDFKQKAGWIIAKPGFDKPVGGLVVRFASEPVGSSKVRDLMSVHLSDPSDTEYPRINFSPQYLKAEAPDAEGYWDAYVPMTALNPDGLEFDRLVIKANDSVSSAKVVISEIALTAVVPGSEKPPKSVLPATLHVDCKAPRHAISPHIYGLAFGKNPYIWNMRPSGRRWGGNPTSRYNWKINAWNTANDWFFRNVTPDISWETFIAENRQQKVGTALTVPILGWVAKDNESPGFPVSKMGKQQNVDPYKPDSGNGIGPDGKNLPSGAPGLTSIEAPPEYVAEWVRTIRELDKRSGQRSVTQYILDNEPALWNSTHRDLHPQALTYDELLDRMIRYGTVVRREDPEAVIAGPAEWGWPAYQWSALDAEKGFLLKPDRRAHGDVPLVEWYLQKLAEHERKTGVRILDVLDFHFYPMADGLGIGAKGNTDRTSAYKRLRSTRALWDPTYVDESWIKEPVRLIPRMKDWIAKNYPGRGISIGEWNFGAENHVSGGLATAEALGRFAEAGITSAYFWDQPIDRSQAYWAFMAFRNYDGKGGRFLDSFVPSSVSGEALKDDQDVSSFVSIDAERKRMVLVWLNLQHDQPRLGTLDVSSCGEVKSVRTWANRGGKEGLTEASVSDGKILLTPWTTQVVELELK